MLRAQLYFVSNEYYQDFPDDQLMQNKDTIDGVPHSRPPFFAFPDTRVPEIYWIVPIASCKNRLQCAICTHFLSHPAGVFEPPRQSQ